MALLRSTLVQIFHSWPGLVMLLMLPLSPLIAQEASTQKPASPVTNTNAPITEIGPGQYQIGDVRLDKNARTLTFPAVLNMNDGLIEYLIVAYTGKTHESLLKTETQPFHIQLGLLLLGAKGAKFEPLTAEPAGGPISASALLKEGTKPVPGDPVRIAIQWNFKEQKKGGPIEDYILNNSTKAPMTRGDFIFNGSRVWKGTFIAQREGSIVSTITDYDALINNPRPGHDHDDNWQIIAKDLPPLGTPVQVVITLPPFRKDRETKPEPSK